MRTIEDPVQSRLTPPTTPQGKLLLPLHPPSPPAPPFFFLFLKKTADCVYCQCVLFHCSHSLFSILLSQWLVGGCALGWLGDPPPLLFGHTSQRKIENKVLHVSSSQTLTAAAPFLLSETSTGGQHRGTEARHRGPAEVELPLLYFLF